MKQTMLYSTIMSEENFNKLELDRKFLVINAELIGEKVYFEVICWEKYIELIQDNIQQEKAEIDNEFITACDTVLNTDPFKNGYHNGHKLIDIYNNDPEWWKEALTKFKNQFILKQMKIINEGIANGKIYN